MEGLFEDLEDRIDFDIDQVLSNETRDSLEDFANAGLEGIDYTTYINQIRAQITTLAVDTTISTLESVEDNLRMANQVSREQFLVVKPVSILGYSSP